MKSNRFDSKKFNRVNTLMRKFFKLKDQLVAEGVMTLGYDEACYGRKITWSTAMLIVKTQPSIRWYDRAGKRGFIKSRIPIKQLPSVSAEILAASIRYFTPTWKLRSAMNGLLIEDSWYCPYDGKGTSKCFDVLQLDLQTMYKSKKRSLALKYVSSSQRLLKSFSKEIDPRYKGNNHGYTVIRHGKIRPMLRFVDKTITYEIEYFRNWDCFPKEIWIVIFTFLGIIDDAVLLEPGRVMLNVTLQTLFDIRLYHKTNLEGGRLCHLVSHIDPKHAEEFEKYEHKWGYKVRNGDCSHITCTPRPMFDVGTYHSSYTSPSFFYSHFLTTGSVLRTKYPRHFISHFVADEDLDVMDKAGALCAYCHYKPYSLVARRDRPGVKRYETARGTGRYFTACDCDFTFETFVVPCCFILGDGKTEGAPKGYSFVSFKSGEYNIKRMFCAPHIETGDDDEPIFKLKTVDYRQRKLTFKRDMVCGFCS